MGEVRTLEDTCEEENAGPTRQEGYSQQREQHGQKNKV